jgi:nicotinic acetylcholine receptor
MEMPKKGGNSDSDCDENEEPQGNLDEYNGYIDDETSSRSPMITSSSVSQPMSCTSFNENGSKSLLANVLNKNDEFGVVNFSKDIKKTKQVSKLLKPKLSNGHIYFRDDMEQAYFKRENSFPQAYSTNNSSDSHDDASFLIHNKSEYLLVKRTLTMILKELRLMTQKIKTDEHFEEIGLNWKFAAMVIDRLCMIVFAFATFISTAGILFTSPNLYKSSDPDPKF